MTGDAVKVSVIVAGPDESVPLDQLYREYAEPLKQHGISYEFVFVTAAEDHGLLEPLTQLERANEPIVLLESAPRVVEAALLRSALPLCRGAVMLLLAPDRRVAPEALPVLVRAIDDGADIVVARRSVEHDAVLNRMQRRIAHRLIRMLVGGSFTDLGSGVRAFRREVLADLPLYGEFSRFLPVFAAREGYVVQECEVPLHPSAGRTRLFSPGVYLRRLVDLLAVFFLIRFQEKPLRFFGLAGGLVSLIGIVIMLVLGWQRFAGQALADRPMLVVAVLLVVLGAQSVALGLIGEIIVHAGAKRRTVYRLARPKS
jgi:hypothetical protein